MINLIYTILCISCLCMGFFVGFRIGQGKEVEIKKPDISKLNPIAKVKEVRNEHKENKELDKLNLVLENLDNYDGTGQNQKEVK